MVNQFVAGCAFGLGFSLIFFTGFVVFIMIRFGSKGENYNARSVELMEERNAIDRDSASSLLRIADVMEEKNR